MSNRDPPKDDDDLACDRCGRQLCDGSCPTGRDPRPVSYDPLPFRLALTDSDTDSGADGLKGEARPAPKQLPFETRYFEKPRLLQTTTAPRHGIVFFRTPSTADPDLELGDPFSEIDADAVRIGSVSSTSATAAPPPQRRRRRRRGRRTQSDSAMTAAMRTAAAHWSASRDPEAVWYADPYLAARTRRRPTNANGALRSSACRAVQCFLVMSAAMSVIILIAIGATMILATSLG